MPDISKNTISIVPKGIIFTESYLLNSIKSYLEREGVSCKEVEPGRERYYETLAEEGLVISRGINFCKIAGPLVIAAYCDKNRLRSFNPFPFMSTYVDNDGNDVRLCFAVHPGFVQSDSLLGVLPKVWSVPDHESAVGRLLTWDALELATS